MDPERLDEAQPEGAAAGPLSCGACEKPLYGFYFQVNGMACCEKCRYEAESEQSRGSGVGRLARAVVGGGFGALVGSGIYYAVLALTGYEVGLVAIVVGFLVGAGVRWGSRGKGGWVYQGLAVTLTYVAIVSTYVPLIFAELDGAEATVVAEAPAPATVPAATPAEPAGAATTDPQPVAATASEGESAAAPVDEIPDITFGEAMFGLAVFGALVLALPFLAGLENLMGLFIIGIGLFQAWVMNRRLPLEIEGPFPLARPGSAVPATRGST
jgi:hypothetical protein